MSQQLLIDALLSQCMVMIARLATTGGMRSPLAHMAQQVFTDLTEELRAQGLGHKVIADMFGLTLRAYHAKVRRLTRETVYHEQTLWKSIIDFLDQENSLSRAQILSRFAREDSAGIVGLLNDMVKSGWVFSSGQGEHTRYRLSRPDDVAKSSEDLQTLSDLLWVQIYSNRLISRQKLLESFSSCATETLDNALQFLQDAGRIKRTHQEGEAFYETNYLQIGAENYSGGIAAMVDHFQAVANTICSRFECAGQDGRRGLAGGSTYHFDLDDEHPLCDEVLHRLDEIRTQLGELRKQVTQVNQTYQHSGGYRVTLYLGQNVQGDPRNQER